MPAVPGKRWITLEPEPGRAERLADALGLPPPIARALVNRGLAEPEDAAAFLNPRLDRLGDPFALPGMRAAADRILQALARAEPLLVFGDYDVDGVSSSALLKRVLERLGGRVANFIPHRIDDGYGLQVDSLRQCLERFRPALIITVDCGTGSVDAVLEARRQGVDVIVTDHHEISGAVAPALAVVNPKLGPDAALHELAGVGVAFKLCHALVKQARAAGQPAAAALDLRELLELVALGSIADMVPLRGENRILARHGLERMTRAPCVGLAALMAVAGVKGPVSGYQVGFLLGPRINAAGRMDHPGLALDLLLASDQAAALGFARTLDEANRERQAVEEETAKAALEQIGAGFDPARDFALVAAAEGWHPGVIGIVASRLVQRFHRPSVVVALLGDGTGKGSCRSIEGFDFIHHLREASAPLRKYGGHAMAAGLEIAAEDVPAFRERFNAVAAATLAGRDLSPTQKIDAWLNPADIGDELLAQTDRLMPFGLGNPTPVWACRGLKVRTASRMGAERQHLKLTFHGLPAGAEAVAFKIGDRPAPEPGDAVDVAFHLRDNVFNGTRRLQLHLQDYRPTLDS